MAAERNIVRDIRGFRSPRPDAAIAVLAERQHGTVGHEQLLALGLGQDAIERRVRCGRLHRVYPGAYAVGHRALTVRGRWMAATLSLEGRLSHRGAAALWGVRGGTAVEVTVGARRAPRPGVIVHRAQLPADEVTTRDGIPVTTIARTLIDLAAVVPADQLRKAAAQAEIQRLHDAVGLQTLLARHRGRRGVAKLRAIFEDTRLGLDLTRSELEERFLAFVRAVNLPRPLTNITVLGYECDAVWHDARLIVELDGRETHGTTFAFEDDPLRDRRLAVAGWRVIRVTWRQLLRDPDALEADLRALLS